MLSLIRLITGRTAMFWRPGASALEVREVDKLLEKITHVPGHVHVFHLHSRPGWYPRGCTVENRRWPVQRQKAEKWTLKKMEWLMVVVV